jgi:hypothetical protein
MTATAHLLSTGDPAADALVGFYVVVLFAVSLLAWECLAGRKTQPRR